MTKNNSNIAHEKVDIENANALLLKKINQGILEIEQGLGQDWDEFKAEWLKEDINNSITH